MNRIIWLSKYKLAVRFPSRISVRSLILLYVFIYFLLALVASREFIAHPGALGHNWDWSIPADAYSLSRFKTLYFHAFIPQQVGQSNLLGISVAPLYFFLGGLGSLGVSGELVSKWLLVLVNFSAGVFMFFLLKNILFRLSNDTSSASSAAAFAGGLFYGFSPFLFNEFIGGALTQFVTYAFVPLFLMLFIEYLVEAEILNFRLFGLLLVSSFISSSLQNIVLSFFLLIPILFWKFSRRSLQLTIIFSLLFFITNLYWIIPALYELFLRASPIFSENFYDFRTLIDNTPSISDAFIALGYFRDFYKMALSPKIKFLWTFSVCFLMSFVILLPLVRSKDKNVRRISIPFLLVFVLSLIFVTGLRQPFVSVVRFCYEKIPLFSLFRSPQHWLLLSTFSLAILLGLGAYKVLRRLNKCWFLCYFLILILVFFWVHVPFQRGDFGSGLFKQYQKGGNYIDMFSLSPGYEQVLSILKREKDPVRVYYYPPENSVYYKETDYQSEAQGGDPFVFLAPLSDITRPSKDDFIGAGVGDITNNLIAAKDIGGVLSNLRILGVRYLVVRKDVVSAFGYLAGADYGELVANKLKTAEGVAQLVDSSEVALFKINEPRPPIFVATNYYKITSKDSGALYYALNQIPSKAVVYSSLDGRGQDSEIKLAEEVQAFGNYSGFLEYQFLIDDAGFYSISLENSIQRQISLTNLDYSGTESKNEEIKLDDSGRVLLNLDKGHYLTKVEAPMSLENLDLNKITVSELESGSWQFSPPDVYRVWSYLSPVVLRLPLERCFSDRAYHFSAAYESTFSSSEISFNPVISVYGPYSRPNVTSVSFPLGSGLADLGHGGQLPAENAYLEFSFGRKEEIPFEGHALIKDIKLESRENPLLIISRVKSSRSEVVSVVDFIDYEHMTIKYQEPGGQYLLVQTMPYDKDWQVDLKDAEHVRVMGYANGWMVNSMSDGIGSEKIVQVKFRPVRWLRCSFVLSALVYISILILILLKRRRVKGEN